MTVQTGPFVLHPNPSGGLLSPHRCPCRAHARLHIRPRGVSRIGSKVTSSLARGSGIGSETKCISIWTPSKLWDSTNETPQFESPSHRFHVTRPSGLSQTAVSLPKTGHAAKTTEDHPQPSPPETKWGCGRAHRAPFHMAKVGLPLCRAKWAHTGHCTSVDEICRLPFAIRCWVVVGGLHIQRHPHQPLSAVVERSHGKKDG